MNYKVLSEFYKGKRVLITGSTGFKGTWLSCMLHKMGCEIIGYALQPGTEPSLYRAIDLEHVNHYRQIYADIRDLDRLRTAICESSPDVVFHLAAQPIVRESYRKPVETYSVNVMGTVAILESLREISKTCSFVNITTDKVYENREWYYGYREMDRLDGKDPYSNSKSCSELVTHSYRESFFKDSSVRISTARAGNVIGGGDFATDRILPDCGRALINAMEKNEKTAVVDIRNPQSIRPYQHVLEALYAYLMIAAEQYTEPNLADCYNVGPGEEDCFSTEKLVSCYMEHWNRETGKDPVFPEFSWKSRNEDTAFHEANYLRLDCSKIRSVLKWSPLWSTDEAVSKVVAFDKVFLRSRLLDQKNGCRLLRNELDLEMEEYLNSRE